MSFTVIVFSVFIFRFPLSFVGRVCYNAGAAGSWLFGWLFASVGGGALTGALLFAVQDVHRDGEIVEGISDSSSARPSQLSGLCVAAVPLGMVISYYELTHISRSILYKI